MNEEVDYTSVISDDVLVHILQMLPADELCRRTRLVCRRWFDLVTNRKLLEYASLILENVYNVSSEVRLLDITAEEQGYTIKEKKVQIPYNGRIMSWCDEYLLMTVLNKKGSLFLYNIITKKDLFLPKCSISCGGHSGYRCGVSLSYDSFKKVYKVVHLVIGPPTQCEIINVNNNITTRNASKWRKINGPIYTGLRKYHWDYPVLVQGRYLNWDVECSDYLLSMDTVEEIFSKTRLPVSVPISVCAGFVMANQYTFVEMGGFLNMLHKDSTENFNIWVLKDYQSTRWDQLKSISVTSFSSIDRNKAFPGQLTSTYKSTRYLIFRNPDGWDSPFRLCLS